MTKKATKRDKALARLSAFCVARDIAVRDLKELGADTYPEPASRAAKFGNPLTMSAMIETLPLARQRDLPDTVVHAIALRNLVFEDNFGLLLKFAYQNRGNHLDKEEAIQAATFGFIRAIEVFDPSRGNQLSTVAALWIRHYCQREMRRTGTTQPKAYLLTMHTMEKHYAKTGRQITAKELGISQARFEGILTQRSFLRLGSSNKGRACGGLSRLTALKGARKTFDAHGRESSGDKGEIDDILRDTRLNAEELVAHHESTDIIDTAINSYSGQAREVMGCLFSEGLNVLATAHKLQITPTSVRALRDEVIADIRDLLRCQDIETP